MFNPDDTIAAISTPPGRGGIGVIRISGDSALAIARRLLPRTPLEARRATLGELLDPATGLAVAGGGQFQRADSPASARRRRVGDARGDGRYAARHGPGAGIDAGPVTSDRDIDSP